jgi:hypothetical protein
MKEVGMASSVNASEDLAAARAQAVLTMAMPTSRRVFPENVRRSTACPEMVACPYHHL